MRCPGNAAVTPTPMLGRRTRAIVLATIPCLCPVSLAAPVIAPGHGDLQIANVSGADFSVTHPSLVTQMAFGPDGRLYCSTSNNGVLRFDYNAASGTLANQTTVSTISGLGIAFHGNEMYLSNLYSSSNGTAVNLSRLYRLTSDASGNWANPIAIAEGIPRDDHGIDNIQIVGDSLYVGVGVRTRNGSTQTFSGDSYGESAYGGSICTIANLKLLASNINTAAARGQSAENIAGFFLPNPTNAQYQTEINSNGSPLTSTAADKLVVHSNGTRNPFGMAVDGDGKIWFTTNQQRISNRVYNKDPSSPSFPDAWQGDGFSDDVYDQLFREQAKGDYGYRNDNWRSHPAGGFFDPPNNVSSVTYDNTTKGALDTYDNTHPHGLGPSSSSDGLDFYKANTFPLAYHHDAFIARWNGPISDGGQTLDFRDVVAVDPATGNVTQIATGFNNPLAVVSDLSGNLLVADYSGSIYRITPTTPFVGPHQFVWGSAGNGNWSQAANWNTPEDASVHMVPHEWGSARYAVNIGQPGSVTVTLDQDAQIETLNLANTLVVPAGHTLTVRAATNVLQNGTILYSGGMLATPSLSLSGGGQFVFSRGGGKSLALNSLSIDTAAGSRLDLADNSLSINYSAAPPAAEIQSLLQTGYHGGKWDGPGLATSLGDASHFALGWADSAAANLPPNSIQVRFTRYGDANLDGSVGFADLVALAGHYGQSNATWDQGDFNYDGIVGFDDLVLLASNYGQSVPGALDPSSDPGGDRPPVQLPAPNSLGLLCLGGAGLLMRRAARA